MKVWILWAVLLIAQNYSFTFVSRARNSGSLGRHIKAALASNGVWFVAQVFTFGTFMKIISGEYGIPKAILGAAFYTVFTVIGSLLAHYHALKSEKGKSAVGANAKYAQIPVEEYEIIKKFIGIPPTGATK